MADRLRALLDHPLDPGAARAILVLTSAILVGFAALFVLASGQADRPPSPRPAGPVATSPGPVFPIEAVEADEGKGQVTPHPQDPQDVDGSAAARRVARALRVHRALQHVPYRDGGVRVTLVGTRRSRAVLRVDAPSAPAARRGWHRFLRRYRDAGGAYLAVFAHRGRDDG